MNYTAKVIVREAHDVELTEVTCRAVTEEYLRNMLGGVCRAADDVRIDNEHLCALIQFSSSSKPEETIVRKATPRDRAVVEALRYIKIFND